MPIFDTHCHYNLEPLSLDWLKHWQKAQAAGVKQALIAGSNLNTSQLAVELASNDENLWASVGIHQSHAHEIDLQSASQSLQQLAKNPQVKAIGETGLDYFEAQASEAQFELFKAQIALADELNLTLIIHARDRAEQAYWDILELLEKHWSAKNPVIFHCISGPVAYIEKAMSIPHSYFGFDGNLTFKNAPALRELFQLINQSAPEKILLETDSPFLAPLPYRGRVCEPWMISKTANFAQAELGADLEQIYQNSLRAFNLLEDNL